MRTVNWQISNLVVLGLLLIGGEGLAAAPTSPATGAQTLSSNGTRRLLSQAVADLRAGKSRQAAGQLAELVVLTHGPLAIEVRYQFAKALYRLDYFHAALAEFETVLEQGPTSKYYRASLEWCLFIGRKLSDDTLVNEVLVRHGEDQFPRQYQDEFVFKLARYHYTQAFFAAAATSEKRSTTSTADTDDAGISFEEDLFGDSQEADSPRVTDGARRQAQPAPAPEMSFGDDLFGDEGSKPSPKPQPSPTDESSYTLARRLLNRVSSTSVYYPRAQFLKGLLLVKRQQENEALKAFKTVIEVTGQAPSAESDVERRRRERLRELSFFQLARLHFGAQQPSFSIFYYRRVDQDSLQWLDALYEASWAEYRLGKYERALGNLLTVHAPFFEDIYFPESLILKAVIYYENCRYQEAEQAIATFMRKYEPLLAQLNARFQQRTSPGDWYTFFARGAGKNQMIHGILLGDAEVRRLSSAERELAEELQRLRSQAQTDSFRQKVYMKRVIERLEQLHTSLRNSTGQAVARKLSTERSSIKTLIAQALRIQVETAKAEEGRLEASLSQRNQRPRRIQNAPVNWSDDEKLVWPFEGEYWRDELGTYELSLVRTCR